MYTLLPLALLAGCALAVPLSQEEIAQYVARQQTAGVGAAPRPRQAYLLQAQPQARASKQAYQPQQYQPQQYQPQQYQEEPQQYYQPQYVPQQVRRPAKPLKPGQPEQEEEDYDPNPQYQFGFDIKDDEFTNYQNRKEQREGNKISGSYSVVDSDGFIRTVKYTADPLEGFKADVTREPTDIKVKIPVHPPQLAPQQYHQYQPQASALRKQQAQQYLQAASPVETKTQYVLRPEHTQVYTGQQGKQIQAYSAPQVGAVAKASYQPKALSYQPATTSPVLYQHYQQ